MKKALAWLVILGGSIIIGWCCGCKQTVATRVVTAPTLPGYIAPSSGSHIGPNAAGAKCPDGYFNTGVQPRQLFPDGTTMPEDPIRGGNGSMVKLVFADGVLYCARAIALD